MASPKSSSRKPPAAVTASTTTVSKTAKAKTSHVAAAAWRELDRWPIWWVLVGLRVVNALTMNSYFQPDEFYQSLEPAWQMAFGEKSGAWLTWVCEKPFHRRSKIKSLSCQEGEVRIGWRRDARREEGTKRTERVPRDRTPG
jgi:hypothetical protein